MNRRSFLKRIFGSFLAVVGVGGGTYYYAHNIETTMLKVQKNKITSVKFPKSFHGFKIVQFSDTHIGFQYTLEQFSKLVATINALQPDIITFTGDLVDNPDNYAWNSELIQLLKSLKAKHGKFWIYGNHDHGGYGTNIVKDTMEQGHFKLLKNEHTVIEKNNDRIILAGIDDAMLGKPDIEKTLQNTNPDLYTILLAHEPDYADQVVHYPVDLQLSGHSHGGQVRLPFIGHLYTPAYAQKYVQGKYAMSDDFILYVSKGIGTTRLPYRFLCKPELNVYTLLTHES